MKTKTITIGSSPVRSSVLGFGCAAVMGRVGRKASLAALGAARDAGITFFDTARSYGYGEAESLLGEFLQGRRSSVLISTKFGILPSPRSRVRSALKPLARTLLQIAPGSRRLMHGQLASQSSGGHFSVGSLHDSLHASLRALRMDYVDFLFLHEPPVNVVQKEDIFAALAQLAEAGKVRCAGVAALPDVVEVVLAERADDLRSVQVPCNLFDLRACERVAAGAQGVSTIANHPFGGREGVAKGKTLMADLAADPATPAELREKLRPADDAALADLVLNLVTRVTGFDVVVASMLQLDHLRTNVAAMERSRFSEGELRWLYAAVTNAKTTEATQSA